MILRHLVTVESHKLPLNDQLTQERHCSVYILATLKKQMCQVVHPLAVANLRQYECNTLQYSLDWSIVLELLGLVLIAVGSYEIFIYLVD